MSQTTSKNRRQKNTIVRARSGNDVAHTTGDITVFGLVITPRWTWQGFDAEHGYAITDPVTGYKVADGKSKIAALINLRQKCREIRKRDGRFLAALDLARREAIIDIERESRA